MNKFNEDKKYGDISEINIVDCIEKYFDTEITKRALHKELAQIKQCSLLAA